MPCVAAATSGGGSRPTSTPCEALYSSNEPMLWKTANAPPAPATTDAAPPSKASRLVVNLNRLAFAKVVNSHDLSAWTVPAAKGGAQDRKIPMTSPAPQWRLSRNGQFRLNDFNGRQADSLIVGTAGREETVRYRAIEMLKPTFIVCEKRLGTVDCVGKLDFPS